MSLKRISPFIRKLFSLVSAENTNYNIRWEKYGKSFIIVHLGEFEENLLSKYFNHSSSLSFFRQLTLYGFKRTTDGRKCRGLGAHRSVVFSHNWFTKDMPNNLSLIRRNCYKIEKTTEPDLVNENENKFSGICFPANDLSHESTSDVVSFNQIETFFHDTGHSSSKSYIDFSIQNLNQAGEIHPTECFYPFQSNSLNGFTSHNLVDTENSGIMAENNLECYNKFPFSSNNFFF